MTDEQKQKAIELARKMGLVVSFTNESGGVYITDGCERKRMEFEEFFDELKTK